MKTSTHLGISQEFRLIIAIFIFSLGGWVWFNFFIQPRDENVFAFELYRVEQNDNYVQSISLLDPKTNLAMGSIFNNFSSDASLDVTSLSKSEGIQLVQANVSNSEENTGEVHVLSSLTSDEENQGLLGESNSDQGVTPVMPPRVAREIEVLKLPFLVTSPPAPEVEDEDVAPISHAVRQRSSINPFAPIVVAKAPPPPPSRSTPPAPTATASTRLANSSAPSVSNTRAVPEARQIAQLPPEVVPPTPRPTAPPSPQASINHLPQALPRGTLPVVPTLLSHPTRSVAVAMTGTNTAVSTEIDITKIVGASTPLAEPVSAYPSSSTADTPSNPNNVETDTVASVENNTGQIGVAIPAPIGALSRSQPSTVMPGITVLSRYLRDVNLSFTGAVLGPINLAVFRANGQSFSVQLGQNLPDTDIVLTNVRNHEVELTQGNESKLLTLDLRR